MPTGVLGVKHLKKNWPILKGRVARLSSRPGDPVCLRKNWPKWPGFSSGRIISHFESITKMFCISFVRICLNNIFGTESCKTALIVWPAFPYTREAKSTRLSCIFLFKASQNTHAHLTEFYSIPAPFRRLMSSLPPRHCNPTSLLLRCQPRICAKRAGMSS